MKTMSAISLIKKEKNEAVRRTLALKKTIEEMQNCMEYLKVENSRLIKENRGLVMDKRELDASIGYLEDLLLESEKKEQSMFLEGKRRLSPDAVLCVMNLLESGVSSKSVRPVVKSVSEFCGISVTDVPSHTTVNEIRTRQLALAQASLQEISEDQNTCLYTDETTRKGRKLMAYAISTETEVRVLGIKEVPTKSAALWSIWRVLSSRSVKVWGSLAWVTS